MTWETERVKGTWWLVAFSLGEIGYANLKGLWDCLKNYLLVDFVDILIKAKWKLLWRKATTFNYTWRVMLLALYKDFLDIKWPREESNGGYHICSYRFVILIGNIFLWALFLIYLDSMVVIAFLLRLINFWRRCREFNLNPNLWETKTNRENTRQRKTITRTRQYLRGSAICLCPQSCRDFTIK